MRLTSPIYIALKGSPFLLYTEMKTVVVLGSASLEKFKKLEYNYIQIDIDTISLFVKDLITTQYPLQCISCEL